jgi:glutathione synthase/RimK-type ligase-like ATP-grasp enzyme
VKARLAVLSAGTGAANNLMRSLAAADAGLALVGCHSDRFVLRKSPAPRNYLLPADARDRVAALREVVKRERVDLVLPGGDADVRLLSDARDALTGRVFLPPRRVVDVCQDKLRLTEHLRRHEVPVPVTHGVASVARVGETFRRFGGTKRLWCRIRTGSGSRGAVPVESAAQTRAWIEYWERMRGVAADEFTLSEYLPGRDFAAQALWKGGELVLVKLCERLSYFGGGSQPSGQSSTPALAKTVDEPRVVDVCTRAIAAFGARISGVFSIDLRENAAGVPCVTEVNAGRFCMITNIFDLTGRHNMAGLFVRLALGERVDIRGQFEAVPDYYLVRDLDTLPGIYRADTLFEGIEEVG